MAMQNPRLMQSALVKAANGGGSTAALLEPVLFATAAAAAFAFAFSAFAAALALAFAAATAASCLLLPPRAIDWETS